MKPSEAIGNIRYARRWMGCESDFSEEALDMAIAVLEQQEKGGWIPVEERLPEMHDAGILKKIGVKQRSEKVIITITEDGTNEAVVDSSARLKDGEWDSDTLRWLRAGHKEVRVTAWMPLPAPYKEDNDG